MFQVKFESSNEKIVTVDDFGVVKAVEEGFASVTVKVLMDDESTYYSETVSVEVKDPYVTTGPSLTHYYGNGGLVDIPKRLSLTEIGSFAFSNFNYIMKTEEELAIDDRETSKQWFIGDDSITKVVIPEGVEKINSYAFANLTALEEVVFPSTLEHIDYGAFYNCTALKKITFSSDNNLKVINQNAFENCALEGTLELPAVCVISDYAFAGNQELEGVVLAKTLISVGQYAFAGCKKLDDITIESPIVKYGAYAFTGCESIKEFYVNAAALPEGMFHQCKEMTKVTIGPDVNDIGVFAFRETKISEFEIDKKNKAFKVQTADHIITDDGKTLVSVSPELKGEFSGSTINADNITEIAKGAFSSNQKIKSVSLDKVTKVGDYGLASNKSLESVKLGELTELGDYAFFEASISEMPSFTEKTKIGKYAFSFSKLTSVTIPDNMEILEGTFSECSALANVVIGNNVTIGDHAFSMNKDTAFKVEDHTEETVKTDKEGNEETKEEKYFYYVFSSPLTSLTIGDNAVIGESAFNNAASRETVTLGEGAELGKMAFYNTSSLKYIDLSKVKSFGDYAISGDVYYACLDDSMTVAKVTSEGTYQYTYHGPQITSIDISSAESIGEYSFSYCRQLVDLKLSDKITEIPKYAFAGCDALKNINLGGIEKIDEYAFMESGLENIDISKCESVGDYAFVSNRKLASVVLNEKGTDIGEGAFSYCDPLKSVSNLNMCENIGDYSFAYDAITEVDLTSAVSIGKNAFLKEEITDFKVTLGDDIEKMGDNPFAMCKVTPFSTISTEKVNGEKKEVEIFDFELSDNVLVVDGSLYCNNGHGLELITFAGRELNDVAIHEDTIRISAYALAGSDVVRAKIPFMTTAIGHKAFYLCDKLEMVMFGSYNVPNFEEEFDPKYYETFDHIPGTGDYGTYTDYDGNEVPITGTGMIPYYMWNATDGQYFTIFYGANFVDYVGYVENKPMVVKPINGVGYDSYICDQYFDLRIDGPSAPDNTAVEAIKAIKAIPERVTLEHKNLVTKARASFDKIATIEQQALVNNYSELITAEQ